MYLPHQLSSKRSDQDGLFHQVDLIIPCPTKKQNHALSWRRFCPRQAGSDVPAVGLLLRLQPCVVSLNMYRERQKALCRYSRL